MIINGQHHPNITCRICGHRHPATITCAAAAASAARAARWQPPVLRSDADLLESITTEYVRLMRGQGHVIGDNEYAACRRMANIQYSWYLAIQRGLGE